MTRQDANNNGDGQEAEKTFSRALIYLRVSTKEQAEMGGEAEGFSIPAQRAACRRKAESLGAVVEEEFVDRGESAKTANRPELMKMLRYVQKNAVQYVIVHKVDRLARSRADDVVITMEIKKSGATLVSCSENIDETPSGLLLHGIMSSIAEFYSQNLATEVTKGLSQKVLSGGTVYKAPLGYLHVRTMQSGREVRGVEIDPERAPLVKWAFEAYADGNWTLRRLLTELCERGLTSRGGPRTPAKPIGMAVLHRTLTNPYYIGVVIYQGVSYPGKHEPLISTQLFERVQSALKAHNCAGERQYVHNHYLKGSIFCGTCGSRLAVTNSRNRHGKVYDYFYCLGRQYDPQSCTWSVVRLRKVEQLVVDHYRTVQLPLERIAEVRDVLRQALSARRTEAEAAEKSLTLRIQRLTDERQKLLQLHYAEAVPVDLFKQEQQRITRELEQARGLLADVSLEFEAIEQNLTRALELARDCHAAYEAAGPNTRRLFNQAFFEKLYVHDDGEITHELAKPFKILLDPRLTKQLASGLGKKTKKLPEWLGDGAWWSDNEDDLAKSEVGGSNVGLLVPPTEFESVPPA